MNSPKSKSIGFYILMVLLFFQTISGLFGGGALVLDPTGNSLQIPISFLDGSPFHNYLIPGFILFTALGVSPGIVFYGIMRRTSWAWSGSVLVSITLIIWIIVEIAMIGYHSNPPLQLIYGSVGIFLLILTQLPSVQIILKPKAMDHEPIN